MLRALRENGHLFKKSSRPYVVGDAFYAGVLRFRVGVPSASESLLVLLNSIVRNAAPEHPFTTVVCNRNTISRPHVDKLNVGLSIIASVGEHTGGDLVVGGSPIAIHNRLVLFNGKTQHYNEMYSGERYSIIWFVHSGIRRITDLAPLIALRFNPPLLLQDHHDDELDELDDEDGGQNYDRDDDEYGDGIGDGFPTQAPDHATPAEQPPTELPVATRRHAGVPRVPQMPRTIILGFMEHLGPKNNLEELRSMCNDLFLGDEAFTDNIKQKAPLICKLQAHLFETVRRKIYYYIEAHMESPINTGLRDTKVFCVVRLDGIGNQTFGHLLHDMRNHDILKKAGQNLRCYYNDEEVLAREKIRDVMDHMDTVHVRCPSTVLEEAVAIERIASRHQQEEEDEEEEEEEFDSNVQQRYREVGCIS